MGCGEVAVHEGEAVFVPLRAGFHRVISGDATQLVAVNVGSPAESDIQPAESVTVAGQSAEGPPPVEAGVGGDIWVWLLMLGLLVVIVEWFTYHRRVTV